MLAVRTFCPGYGLNTIVSSPVYIPPKNESPSFMKTISPFSSFSRAISVPISFCAVSPLGQSTPFDVRIQNAVEKRTYGNTGISENSTYPLCFQTFNNRICSNHFALLLYLYSIISVVSDSFTSGFWPVSRHPPHPWNSRRHRSHPHIPA